MKTEPFDRPQPGPATPGLDETQKLTLDELRLARLSCGPAVPGNGDQVSEIIQGLMEITHNGEEGFQQAAQQVHDRGLRDEFHKFARERRSMVAELQDVTKKLGSPVLPPPASPKAPQHRNWIHMRTVATNHDDQAILDAAERGEDAALAAYRAALAPTLPAMVRAALQSLTQKVQRAHDRVQSLRDSGLYHQH